MNSQHYLGKQHDSKPVTAADKVMSKRHLAHRAQLDKMPDNSAKKALSQKYNISHAKEHLTAAGLKDVAKKIKAQAKAIKKSIKN